MSKSFNYQYTLSQFKLDAMTFCNIKSTGSYFYYIIQNYYQKGLDEKLLNRVSLAKDVLSNKIENTYRSFLVKDALDSLCAKILIFFIKHSHYYSCFS